MVQIERTPDLERLVQSANETNKAANPDGPRSVGDVNLDEFLKLMIAELQNQDPLNPMDNAQLMEQIGQMREIAANDSLTKTLETVLTRQNLTTASSLIGQSVNALDDEGNEVTGLIDRVTMATDENDERTVRVQVGDQSIRLSNIREIVGSS